jgi:cytochrome c oxidase subunit 3
MGQQQESASIGMWMFLVQEIMFFGGLFTVYLVFRSKYPMAFAAGSNHLDAFWGGLNTLVLIVSSLTMAWRFVTRSSASEIYRLSLSS